ncbi:MAG TPA: TolC family protein [Kofleriaceae bacterium]|nr:TolC family protein [Kofleriaceae bacterium]
MTRSLTVLLFAALSLSTRPASAERISRADVMKRAARHPTTEAAHSQIDQVRAQKRQADALRWPRISLSLGLIPSLRATLVEGSQVDSVERATDYKLGDVSPGFTGDLTIIQPLYTFGKIAHRQRAAELGVGAQTAQARMRQADVATEGAELYEKYLLARDLLGFLEDTDHILTRSIEATEERLAARVPDISQHDLLRLKTARGPLIVGLHQAQAGTLQAEAGLRAYFGLRDGTAIEPVDARLEAIPTGQLTLAELVRRAYSDRPELVALASGAAAVDALARAERAGYLPDIVALGFVSGAYTVDRDPVESRFVYDPSRHFVPGIGLGLRWELWGDSAGARADEQRARGAELRHLESWARTALSADVTNAYQELERARADLPALAAARTSAKEWVVRASADYAAGMVDSIALTDAVDAYVTNRLAELDAVYRFNVALARMSRAIGAVSAGESLYAGGVVR